MDRPLIENMETSGEPNGRTPKCWEGEVKATVEVWRTIDERDECFTDDQAIELFRSEVHDAFAGRELEFDITEVEATE